MFALNVMKIGWLKIISPHLIFLLLKTHLSSLALNSNGLVNRTKWHLNCLVLDSM